MASDLISFDKFLLAKLNRSLNALFSSEEMQVVYSNPDRLAKFNTLSSLSSDEINIINSIPDTKSRVKHYILYSFSHYEHLSSLSIYKNGLLILSQIFDSSPSIHTTNRSYYPNHYGLTIADALTIEVVINSSLVWLSIRNRCIIDVCDTLLVNYIFLLNS